jgi:hypothetical protein
VDSKTTEPLYSKSTQNRACVFTINERKPVGPVPTIVTTSVPDDCCGDNVWVVGVGAADGDGFAEEINVSVAGAGVGAVCYDNRIAIES